MRVTGVVEPVDDEVTAAVDYLPGVRGHAVVTMGQGADGGEALAVWRLGPTGRAVGAWVFASHALVDEGDLLGRVIESLFGRCLVDWTADGPAQALEQIAAVVPSAAVAALRDSLVVIPDLLAEITELRQRYAGALEAHRATAKSKFGPLVWAREVPDGFDAARRSLTPALSGVASPVAAQALGIAGALERAVELWQDTEQARYRRSYLRSLGEVQALPPRWMARLRAAATAPRLSPLASRPDLV